MSATIVMNATVYDCHNGDCHGDCRGCPQTPITHIKSLERKKYADIFGIVMSEKVKLRETDWCYAHETYCRRLPDPGSKDTLSIIAAGSPCPDWSNFGKHCKDGGPAAPLFVVLTLGQNNLDSYITHTSFLTQDENDPAGQPTHALA